MRKKPLVRKNEMYEQAVNSLLSKAEEHANAKIDKKDYKSHEAWGDAWNTAFHGKMNELAFGCGLRNKLVCIAEKTAMGKRGAKPKRR
jgi:hypothetical protein